MAWTWSAPQRGRVAGSVVALSGHKVISSALNRAAVTLGRGDATRGLMIGFAAFLTIAGAAAPHVSPLAMTAFLFLSGAALVIFAGSSGPAAERAAEPVVRIEAPRITAASLSELLMPARATSVTDRAAFARLTAHMSHELRTPLNAILGFSELMSSEVFGPLGSSSYANYVRDIHASGLSLLKSADDALAITQLLTASDDQTRAKHAHPHTAGTEALAFHSHGLSARGITSSCTIDGDADIIACPQAVRQLLINLIADAAATAGDGAHIALASRTDGCDLELSIVTTGPAPAAASQSESFSMLLARTLAELCGAKLLVLDRHVTVRFARVAQNDFFGYARRAA